LTNKTKSQDRGKFFQTIEPTTAAQTTILNSFQERRTSMNNTKIKDIKFSFSETLTVGYENTLLAIWSEHTKHDKSGIYEQSNIHRSANIAVRFRTFL